MEDYQKRMIEEFEELNERTMKLERFLEAPEMEEKRATLSEEMLSAMHCQYSGMVVYRSNLARRLELLGLAEHIYEYPELTVGEVFADASGKTYKCIGHEENGCPICQVIPEEEVADPFECEVKLDKQLRKDLDALLQKLQEAEKSRERSLSITKLQEAIMWLGMDLKRLGTANPYPEGKNPESLRIEPTADGLKM